LVRSNPHFGLRRLSLDIAQGKRLDTTQRYSMPPFIYRCPNTGFRVQGLPPDDDEPEGADDVFVGVTCLACGGLHFVSPKTGKMVGESSE